MNENDQSEIEIVDLAPTLQKVKDAFSASAESFSRRFQAAIVDGGLVGNLEDFQNNQETTTKEFIEFSNKISAVVSSSKDGLDLDSRADVADELKQDRDTIAELGRSGDLSNEEFMILDETLKTLTKEINPRTLSRRLIDGSINAGKEFGKGVGNEVSSATRSLQGHLIGLADEFPPLQIAMEKTGDILSAILGKLISKAGEFFTNRSNAKQRADVIRSTKDDTIIKPSSERVVENDNQQTNKRVEREDNEVELGNKTIKKLKRIMGEDDDGLSPTQSAILAGGALSLVNKKEKDPKKKKGGFGLLSIIPALLVVVPILAGLLVKGILFGLPALLLASAAALGVAIGNKIHEIFPDLRLWLTDRIEDIVNLPATLKTLFMESVEFLLSGISTLVDKALSIGENIKETAKDVTKSVIDTVVIKPAIGLSNTVDRLTGGNSLADGKERMAEVRRKIRLQKAAKLERMEMTKVENLSEPTLDTTVPTLSENNLRENEEISSLLQSMTNALGVFGGSSLQTTVNEKTLINTNNNSSTNFIHKVSPDNFESSFNRKKSEGFPD